MKYKIFTTDSLEALINEQLLGEADNYQEACKIISNNLSTNNSYWRFLMGDIATFVDYGSWSKFIAIVPPVPMKEMMGED